MMTDIPFPEVPFISSQPVSQDVMREAGCFTMFEARINLRDALANVGSKRAVADFSKVLNLQRHKYASCLESPGGNMVSLTYPEVLPERVELVAYLTELGFLHDDYTEPENVASLAPVHERLDYAIDPSNMESPDGSTKSMLMKKIFSAVILECLEIDLNSGLDMMKHYSEQWLKVVDTQPILHTTLDEYLEHRIRDTGSCVVFWQIAFGAGIRLTESDYNMLEPLFKATIIATLLANDFFSWAKERDQPRDRITNAILFYMNTTGIAEQEAAARLKQDIIDKEHLFLEIRDRFCRSHPDLPSHMKLMVNILAPFIGGWHYWCCICPRYNSMHDPSEYAKSSDTSLENEFDNKSPLRLAKILRSAKPDSENNLSATPTKLGRTALEGPIRYIQSLDSKNVRSQLIEALNLWLGLPYADVNMVKEIVNDLHNSSLILDDIQDGSLLRRGGTAAHIIFGTAQSINSATYIFVRVAKQAHVTSNSAFMTVLLDSLETLFVGQSWELNWKATMTCPTEEEYFAMIDHKTGAMFQMLFRMMLTLVKQDSNEDLSQSTVFDTLAKLMGRWYQVRDDYLNLQEGEYTKKKGFCEDLDEGKFSYPVIRCCTADDAVYKDIMIGILHRRDMPTLPHESKLQILDIMEKTGAMHETCRLIMELQTKIEKEIGQLETILGEANPILRVLVKVLGNIPEPHRAVQ